MRLSSKIIKLLSTQLFGSQVHGTIEQSKFFALTKFFFACSTVKLLILIKRVNKMSKSCCESKLLLSNFLI